MKIVDECGDEVELLTCADITGLIATVIVNDGPWVMLTRADVEAIANWSVNLLREDARATVTQ